MAQGDVPSQVVTLGTEMVVHAQRDAAFRDCVNACALSLCDTAGLLAVARARGAPLRERVTGVELIEHVCAQAAALGVPVFLLGGAPGIAEEAARALRSRYVQLHIAGTRDGYFPDSESGDIARLIRESGARIVFSGIGSPRQELWLHYWLAATGCAVGIGVGGSLDVISGRVKRAPRFFRALHTEWLYRLLREPRRWRRQLALPRFVMLILGEAVRNRLNRRRRPQRSGPAGSTA